MGITIWRKVVEIKDKGCKIQFYACFRLKGKGCIARLPIMEFLSVAFIEPINTVKQYA